MTATRTPSETHHDTRIERLNSASLRRIVEPDSEVVGSLTKDQIIPDELLSIAGLDLDLTAEQKATLSREEVASVTRFGILFEAILMSGFAYQLALSCDVGDPRFTYALHEIGEETRHSRLFVRLHEEIAPTHSSPLNSPLAARVRSRILPLLLRRPALLDTLVLAGEEIPDLLQKMMSEHPDTDEYVRAISKYHRMEEARHLAFARMTVGERYRSATRSDRFAVRNLAPWMIAGMFDFIVQPQVYRTVGLPGMATWRAARQQPQRIEWRRQCARAVLHALVDAGVLRRGGLPRPWRRVAGVDQQAEPIA